MPTKVTAEAPYPGDRPGPCGWTRRSLIHRATLRFTVEAMVQSSPSSRGPRHIFSILGLPFVSSLFVLFLRDIVTRMAKLKTHSVWVYELPRGSC